MQVFTQMRGIKGIYLRCIEISKCIIVMHPFSCRYHLLSRSATGIVLCSGWIWESGILTASTRLNHSLSSAQLRVLYLDFANRWSYLHETDDEAAAVNCPEEVGRANQIASVSMSITVGQLHKRNRSKSYLHRLCPAAPGPGEGAQEAGHSSW